MLPRLPLTYGNLGLPRPMLDCSRQVTYTREINMVSNIFVDYARCTTIDLYFA
jgi:hypothetical protein